MHTIEPDVEQPDCELVEAFEGIPGTIVLDVIGNIGLTMDVGLRPAYDGVETAGIAVMVKATLSDNFIIHKMITLTELGDVFIIDCNGYIGTGRVNGPMYTSCQANGLTGLVVNGAYRDNREIAEMEFPMYGRDVNPQRSFKQGPGSVDAIISIGGASVDPGDVVIGDDDGLAVTPRRGAEEVLERTYEKLSIEDSAREEVLKGRYLYELNGYDELFENLTVVSPEDSIR